MQSKTISAKNIAELNTQLINVVENNFQPTVAIVCTSAAYDLKSLSKTFTDQNIDLVGCTTAGEICDKEILEETIVVLLMDMNKSWYRTHYVETKESTTFKIAKETGVVAKSHFENPAIVVFSGGIMVDGEQVVFGMKAGAGEVPVFGGLAGDDQAKNNTYIFNNESVSENGMISLIIDMNKVEVKGMATSGWEPIGNVNTITKSEGNVVYAINEEPALDVFIRYFGSFTQANESDDDLLNTLSGQYPLQILREEGHNILRSPVMADQDARTLILAGGVKEGDQFRFSISPGFEVIDQTLAEFGKFNQKTAQADAMLLVSCKGRHAAFGPMLEDEVKGISDYWNAPMIGFMAYGEIGPNENGTCEFHNETCSLVTFKEK